MKILIHYNQNLTHRPEFVVSHVSSLESLIEMFPDEDIDGEIYPCAKHNPELEEILMRIWSQKHNLWLQDKISTEKLFDFISMLKSKFGITAPL